MKEFLANYIQEFRDYIEKVLTVIPRSPIGSTES